MFQRIFDTFLRLAIWTLEITVIINSASKNLKVLPRLMLTLEIECIQLARIMQRHYFLSNCLLIAFAKKLVTCKKIVT